MGKILSACLLLTLLTACVSPLRGLSPAGRHTTNEHPWAEALRALDPVDGDEPAHDITAVYLRQVGNLLQIRVDLLGFQTAKELSLDLRIGDESAPGAAPLTVHIPSEDNPDRIEIDPLLATVIVSVPLSAIPSRPRVDVSTPRDEIAGLRLEGPVPTRTAPLLLAFYDTFAGRFPAEALRSWDGAHTGPRGERHGLKHLLDAVEENQTPVVLLDLKEPENMSALDAIGVLPQIRRMQEKDLLSLPQSSTGPPLFGLPLSLYWFEPSPTSQSDSITAFQFTTDTSHLHRWFEMASGIRTSVPISAETGSTQPTSNGPSLEVRRALLETALNADEKDLLVLGGSLRASTWGSPGMAGVTLAYFASRPYIHILTADDLIGFPKKFGKPELRPSPLNEPIDRLEAHYETLTRPVTDFVKNWKGSPLASCDSDPDKDNLPECILANEHYLAILDPQGGRLTYLFAVERDSISLYLHQLIGPSWQVAVGLSNPSLWDLSAGEAADPGAYPGAFTDVDDPFKPYEPAIEGDTVVFTSLDGTRVKTFRLNENGLEVTYQTPEPVITQIPLLVDPETRFTPGWAQKYAQEKTPGGVAWGLENGPVVRIQHEGPITIRAFNESLSLLAGPEDPDFDYLAGHFVPFPVAVAEVEMQDGYFLRLERLP